MLSKSLQLAGVDSTYSLVADKDCFQRSLQNVPCPMEPQSYVGLHVSSHGDRTGISLMSGEMITWYELCQMLLPLNRRANSGLVVTMSTCHGLFGAGMALELHMAPYAVLVGPVSEVSFSDAAVAYIVFYHQISKGETFAQAVAAMKIGSGEHRFGIVDGEATRTGLLQHLKNHGVEDIES